MTAAKAQSDDAICFTGPKEAKKEEVQKAAEALAKRCAAYGYSGVSASVEEKDGTVRARLTCEGGFTDSMVPVVKKLARQAAQKVEIKLARVMSDAEKEQFKPGAWVDPKSDKSPKGSFWSRMISAEFEDDVDAERKRGPVVLLLSSPSVTLAEMGKPVKSDYATEYTFSEAATKRLRDALVPPKVDGGFDPTAAAWLVIDGKALNAGVRLVLWSDPTMTANGVVRRKTALLAVDEQVLKTLEPVLRNPMPFALMPVEEK